jgi:1-acyl-sn-glycerol-3-phosphate acyltransferase
MKGLLGFLEELARTVAAVSLLTPLVLLVSTGAIVQRLLGAPPSQVHWAYRVSNLDPFAIMDAIRELVIRFVIKRQLIQVPIFGHALASTGNASVERRGRGDMRRIRAVLSRRDPRISLLFFAEGTRSRDGRLHPFKKGAFATAIATGLPLLPVGVAGSYFVLQPGRWWLRRGGIAIEIGAPIPVTERADRDALHEEAFAVVAKLRAQARARLRAADFEPGGRDD